MSAHTVRLIGPGGDPVQAVATTSTEGGRNRLRLELAGGGGEFSSFASDLFECLIQLRQQLEPFGYRFLVNGARRNVWPSGMGRDMGAGLQAYCLVLGKPAQLADLVGIFEPAAESDISTVQEQESFFRAWVASSAQNRKGG